MRMVILTNNDKTLVEWSPNDIKKLLAQEFTVTKDIERAFDRVVLALKKKTQKLG